MFKKKTETFTHWYKHTSLCTSYVGYLEHWNFALNFMYKLHVGNAYLALIDLSVKKHWHNSLA